MRTAKPSLRSSFFGWLAPVEPVQPPDNSRRLLQLRTRMLGLLRECPAAPTAGLVRRIAQAPDGQALWHCRGELMQALCRGVGEGRALTAIAELAPCFDGLVPPALLQTSGRRLRA